jgi:ABC-2 type transport system ATP-binding protein
MVVSGPVEEVRRQLQGGSRLRIRVLRGLEAAEAQLRQLVAEPQTGLPRLGAVRHDQMDDQALIVELADGDEEAQAQLLMHLVGQGVLVSEFRPQAENLEELFLRLTAVD